MRSIPFNVALIIPTGIGASIGGFGGDGMTLLPLLSSICDTVITHPNVANAACFQTLPQNTLYVEGFAMDRFFEGKLWLKPVRKNRIGIIWDSAISPEMKILHQNTVAAVQTVYGVDIAGFENTKKPVALELILTESGRSTGSITNPEVLIEAGQYLLDKGATALAICCKMPDCSSDYSTDCYKTGVGVDPIGGIEAMISHFVVSMLCCPAAHSPVFSYDEALPVTDHTVDPRAASEFIVSTFLPSVLTGLSRAPQYRLIRERGVLGVDDISSIIVPGDALGSIPVFASLEKNIPIIAVCNNNTVMQCTSNNLSISDKVIECSDYLQAIGILTALKNGITIPEHFISKH